MTTSISQNKRFAIAVSFPGEHRRFVKNVVTRLAQHLGRERVFFDDWYQPELLGLDADIKLKNIYRDQSELVVPFFSEYYEKDWCQIEWSAIRVILKARRKDAVVPVQIDGTKVDGWEEIDFAIRKGNRTGKQVADLIFDAYQHRYNNSDGREMETSINSAGSRNLQSISKFEQQHLDQTTLRDLDQELIAQLWPKIVGQNLVDIDEISLCKELSRRSFMKKNPKSNKYHATAMGLLLFGKDPTLCFSQCRIIAEFYKGETSTGKPDGYKDIRASIPIAIEKIVLFVEQYTKTTFRIVDLDRIQIEEYPKNAIREAVVNALAHRDYERSGERIMVRVFKNNRLVISSPGGPPDPLKISNLMRGNYDAVWRNPSLADNLNRLEQMEGRGKGFALMKAAMQNHGLEAPMIKLAAGTRFEVTLNSPGETLDSIKTSSGSKIWSIEESEKRLFSDRQRAIIAYIQANGYVTSGWCQSTFNITRETAVKDIRELLNLEILNKIGKGPATRYELCSESSDDRQEA